MGAQIQILYHIRPNSQLSVAVAVAQIYIGVSSQPGTPQPSNRCVSLQITSRLQKRTAVWLLNLNIERVSCSYER